MWYSHKGVFLANEMTHLSLFRVLKYFSNCAAACKICNPMSFPSPIKESKKMESQRYHLENNTLGKKSSTAHIQRDQTKSNF